MPRSVWREPDVAEYSDLSPSCQSAPFMHSPERVHLHACTCTCGLCDIVDKERTDHTIRLTILRLSAYT